MPFINIGSQISFGAVGSAFGARTAVAAGINTSVAIPAGFHLVETDANTTVRFTYDGGTTFVTILAISSSGFVYSDGFNVEFRGGAAAGTGHRSQVNGF